MQEEKKEKTTSSGLKGNIPVNNYLDVHLKEVRVEGMLGWSGGRLGGMGWCEACWDGVVPGRVG